MPNERREPFMVLNNTEFKQQFAAATRRGNKRLTHEPVADRVCYDRRLRRIVIELSNGCTLLVPPELSQGLSKAAPRDLAQVKVLGPGTSIEWPNLDVQLSVAGLLAGRFGTAAWTAQRIGTKNGSKRSHQSRRKATS